MTEKHDRELSQRELSLVVGGIDARWMIPLLDQKSWLRKRAFEASQDDKDQPEKRRHGKLDGAAR